MATKGTFKLVLVFIAVIVGSTIYNGYQETEKKQKQIAMKSQQRLLLANQFKQGKDKILSNINKRIAENDFKNALLLISKYQELGDKDINEAFKKARTAVVLEELKSIPTERYQKNLNLYNELANLNPGSNQYNEKIKFYTPLAEQQKIKSEAASNRKKLIQSAFSPWDGSHLALERYVISSMNDPDSYDHVETSYRDNGSYIFVVTKFRGRNGFGGLVIDSVTAKTSIEGKVLEIIN